MTVNREMLDPDQGLGEAVVRSRNGLAYRLRDLSKAGQRLLIGTITIGIAIVALAIVEFAHNPPWPFPDTAALGMASLVVLVVPAGVLALGGWPGFRWVYRRPGPFAMLSPESITIYDRDRPPAVVKWSELTAIRRDGALVGRGDSVLVLVPNTLLVGAGRSLAQEVVRYRRGEFVLKRRVFLKPLEATRAVMRDF